MKLIELINTLHFDTKIRIVFERERQYRPAYNMHEIPNKFLEREVLSLWAYDRNYLWLGLEGFYNEIKK